MTKYSDINLGLLKCDHIPT